ncbi:hypothetical protein SAY87_013880 [Trapa incisa]|uniref:Uncharacterized protein n=1 Tax=Trapa incisa TaxID=236973 RepID=A0AAN7KE68_9MYRT|nr:hypothetical protein SAY87_013880 [Trapa incisa]
MGLLPYRALMLLIFIGILSVKPTGISALRSLGAMATEDHRRFLEGTSTSHGGFIPYAASKRRKERKLKDVLRSGNCIVKQFQKSRDRGDRRLISAVLAQVEVRLISRVLNMARPTRDQVVWCHEKLDRIIFVGRKIHLDPSFLLFLFRFNRVEPLI